MEEFIKHALGTVLHEVVEGSTQILGNRKGELHDLVDKLVNAVIGDLADEDVPADAPAAPAAPVTQVPADGAASA